MKRLNDKDHAALLADMRSFDVPMPCVGAFSFDSGKKVLLNVCKKEITPKMIEDARAKGVQVIECPTRFESHSLPSGRIIWNTDKFEILVGRWAEPIQAELSELLEQEFSLPYFEFVYDEHRDLGHGWSGDMPGTG